MPETDINQLDISDLKNQIADYAVTPVETDGIQDQDETTWQLTEWSTYLGYYKSIPELQTAVDAKANWVMGAGFEAEEQDIMLLDAINGYGKDSFNSILLNMIRTFTVAGDAYAEIIRSEDGSLLNLKPLDPSSIKIVVGKNGLIKRYEQVSKVRSVPDQKIKATDMLHLSRKRLADEVHGISVIPSVKWIIDARNEAMSDWKRVLHRNVEPLWIFHLDTDDATAIASMKTKYNAARKDGENMFIPKGAVVPELVSTATNAGLNPLAWINQLNDYFFQAVNVPQIIIGNAKEFTDASGKIVYLSYEQSVKGEQLYIEEQILAQLGVEIALTFPASLQNDLITGREKDPNFQASQPNDTTAELEGNT